MIDTKKLTKDLIAAQTLAALAIEGMDDGGTCNFDGLFFPTGKGQAIGRKSAQIEAAIEASGASTFHKGYGFRRGYVVSLKPGGQAATRTKAAEVACKQLQAQGWAVSMWYQMD